MGAAVVPEVYRSRNGSLATGAGIPIEERDSEEVVRIFGRLIAPEGVPARYPAFDVTPAALVTGIITEKGIARASEKELLQFWPRQRESKAYLT